MNYRKGVAEWSRLKIQQTMSIIVIRTSWFLMKSPTIKCSGQLTAAADLSRWAGAA